MGSSEEERLVQMIDDFIESPETPISSSSSSSSPLPLTSNTHYFFTLKEILGNTGRTAEIEVSEAVMKHMRRKIDAPKTTPLKKWLVMKLKMDGYHSCDLCHSSWVTSMGCPPGDYEYIEMKAEGGKRMIIDIDFKAQFEVARATESYKQLTQALPSVFVGSEEKVVQIISILCSAAKQSLKESGLHIPPWRTSTYMQRKWVAASQQRPKAAPLVKAIGKRVWGGGSALSTQFSNMSINCC
ncbi:uncharacterized protein LOC111451460 isoform X1 [Cucurbita moschata]|uniref:Uncharacterized protein LOC111451460 isoform X1 n=1 Tax=Cucurbita moschata TaxID=3662 RepID=A0A6J1G7H8_CUCMO|nr:uncharacterized protein LOC111451460 isoform X1 [Cucurbita moschata]XP_022947664.1 uncharacterized protein LOC111451460 isoform X2 [Cucurbita moschata]XP_022947665.1 uncharacterized protein LOC111451460 isoform X1 [Cucurbita moschata]